MSRMQFGLAVENFVPSPKRARHRRRSSPTRAAPRNSGLRVSVGVGPHVPRDSRSRSRSWNRWRRWRCWPARPSGLSWAPAILVLPLRGAAVLAKTATTVELISERQTHARHGSRLVRAGVRRCGVPFRRRARIFEENLELMQQFWTGERVSGEARGDPVPQLDDAAEARAAPAPARVDRWLRRRRRSSAWPSDRTAG